MIDLFRQRVVGIAVLIVGAAGFALAGCSSAGSPVVAPSSLGRSSRSVSASPSTSGVGSAGPVGSGTGSGGAAASKGALAASGGFTGSLGGPFLCETAGVTRKLAQFGDQGALGLFIHAEDGKVVSGSMAGKGFAGSPSGGLPGSLVITGGTATVTGVTIPSLAGGAALVVNGTVRCDNS
jgi:hypothetical protein